MTKTEKAYTIFDNEKPKNWNGFIMLFKTAKQAEKFRDQAPQNSHDVKPVTITYEVKE